MPVGADGSQEPSEFPNRRASSARDAELLPARAPGLTPRGRPGPGAGESDPERRPEQKLGD